MPPAAAAPAKRHKKGNEVRGLTKSAIYKLARRGGCKRVATNVVPEIRDRMNIFLRSTLEKAIIYAKSNGGNTMRPMDIILALKRQGRTIYA